MITKRQLLVVFKTNTAIARVAEVSIPAVTYWGMDEPIPAIRELLLQVKFPKMFGKPNAKELLPRLLAEQGPRQRKFRDELPRAYGT